MRAFALSTLLLALMLFGLPANAATLHFFTVSTSGVFSDGSPGSKVQDVSARFSFDISSSIDAGGVLTYTVTDGIFTDSNVNLDGDLVKAVGLEAGGVAMGNMEIDLQNTDGAGLNLVFSKSVDATFSSFSGTYAFAGPVGEIARGNFLGKLVPVPLPSSALLLGAALMGLAGIGSAAKRRISTVASFEPQARAQA